MKDDDTIFPDYLPVVTFRYGGVDYYGYVTGVIIDYISNRETACLIGYSKNGAVITTNLDRQFVFDADWPDDWNDGRQ